MKTVDYIPVSKVQRASKIVETGAKVGLNYVKYFGDKILNSEEQAKQRLDISNASDIYDGLKSLKGSALKVAQMLSMEQNILPKAYVDKFSLSQFSVPPLSSPLVQREFRKAFGKFPNEIFDTFSKDAIHAASIGQVHKAEKNGEIFAVKIQYPGVSDSVSSDLALIKPFALKMLNIDKNGSEKYFKEVESKLLEETDYHLELKNSVFLSEACKNVKNVVFPTYFSEYSSKNILTMEWMNGKHLSEFAKSNATQEQREVVGQALWDLFMHQIHQLKMVHADPHPGNFLVSKENELIVLDFGCVKEIPEDFYSPYFQLIRKIHLENDEYFRASMLALEILKEDDKPEDIAFLNTFFKEMLSLFTLPFQGEIFDFSDDEYFTKIAKIAEGYSKDPRIKKIDVNRGSKHFIYMNRVFFGLYSLMNSIKAKNTIINNYTTFI